MSRTSRALIAMLACVALLHFVHNFSFPFSGVSVQWADFRNGIILSQPILLAFGAVFALRARLLRFTLAVALTSLIIGACLIFTGAQFAGLLLPAAAAYLACALAMMGVRRWGWSLVRNYGIDGDHAPRFTLRVLLISVMLIAIGLAMIRASAVRGPAPYRSSAAWLFAAWTLGSLRAAPTPWLLMGSGSRLLYANVSLVVVVLAAATYLAFAAVFREGPRAMLPHVWRTELTSITCSLLSLLPLRLSGYRLILSRADR